MNKLDVLAAVIEEFGLTYEEIIRHWAAGEKISTAFLSQTAEDAAKRKALTEVMRIHSEIKRPKYINPGMYYYAAENLIHPKIIDGLQVSAVVGSVDSYSESGILLGLRETECPWSSTDARLFVSGEYSGRDISAFMLSRARRKNEEVEALRWCDAYDYDGLPSRQGFLLSHKEWTSVFANFVKINRSLRAVKADVLKEAAYWSVHESLAGAGTATPVRYDEICETAFNDCPKREKRKVRCAFLF